MEKKAVKKAMAKKRGRPAKKKTEEKVVTVKEIEKQIEKNCGTCRHGFQSVFEDKVNCKRFPPIPVSGGNHIFPTIEKLNICGEWEGKE